MIEWKKQGPIHFETDNQTFKVEDESEKDKEEKKWAKLQEPYEDLHLEVGEQK